MQETWVSSLGWEDPLEKGKATHSSILAWRIPWTIYSMGSQESDTTERLPSSSSISCLYIFPDSRFLVFNFLFIFLSRIQFLSLESSISRTFSDKITLNKYHYFYLKYTIFSPYVLFNDYNQPFVWWSRWLYIFLAQISSVQSLSRVWLFASPWTAACQASQSIANSRSPPKPMSIESVMPSNHLILSSPSSPALKLSQHQDLFQWVSSLHQVAKVLEFQLQQSPSNEHPGLISFRIDWVDLLAVQGTLKSLLQHYSSKASVLRRSAFFIVQHSTWPLEKP